VAAPLRASCRSLNYPPAVMATERSRSGAWCAVLFDAGCSVAT
jgi:hypothetical protein